MKIKEIFTSIQGEGPFIGYKQLFIRFCDCNLKCKYCDTAFESSTAQEYSLKDLLDIVNNNKDCHSISLTGGEPLLHVEFLKEFILKVDLPIYLETNGTLYNNLSKIMNNVDYISADIKLPSCTGLKDFFEEHDKFLEIAKDKYLYAKVVFDKNITEEEILQTANLCKKYNIELVLQPKMINNKPDINSDFMISTLNKFLKLHHKTRLIPQVHKFIDVV